MWRLNLNKILMNKSSKDICDLKYITTLKNTSLSFLNKIFIQLYVIDYP